MKDIRICGKDVSLLGGLLGLWLVFAPQTGAAADCAVNVDTLAFGTYNLVNNLDAVTTIDLACDKTKPGSEWVRYTLSLSSGPGSYAARQLSSGSNVLYYNLYEDAAHTIVWGDGTGGSNTVASSFRIPPNTGRGNATHTVYGRIPGGQNIPAGSYSASYPITLTMTF